jgi:hypothetical protein
MATSRALYALPLFITFAAGCAHAPPAPSLTSAQAAVPVPGAPAAVETPKAPEPVAPVPPPAEEAAPKPKKAEPQELSFEQLSAQLGGDDKLALDSDQIGDGQTVAREGKGLSANGYTAVGATHQAVPEASDARGDVKVSGGLTVAQVRGTVKDANSRLRHCYERGLHDTPHLAGLVTVTLSVDAKGEASGVDAASETLPAVVTTCVTEVFSSMTFAAPKAPPAKVVYPIEFRKE